jgi:hypothetical protein
MGMETEIGSKGSALPSAKDTGSASPLLRAFAPLHRTAMGVAWGVVCGGVIALATVVPVVKGEDFLSFGLLAQFFWGYSVTWRGVFTGLLWGFGVGFALGYGFALIRNAAVWLWLTVIRSRAEMDQYSDLLDRL